MAKTVNMHEAKTRLSELVRMARGGEDVILASDGKPVARLIPIPDAPQRGLGADRGSVWIADDFDSILEDEAAAWGL